MNKIKVGGKYYMSLILGILIPFIGTTLGASMVFFMKKEINNKIEKFLLGFASGVMIAASIWSLIIPAINMSEHLGRLSWIPASIGFILGIFFLIILDFIISRLHIINNRKYKINYKYKKTLMMVLVVTLHNIPEGMAVGVAFAGAIIGNTGITMIGALILAIGIAIQNFPEGAIISMPLKSQGGIVEPIGAAITILLTSFVVPVLPYLLSFAAGAMIYVVVEELIPECQQEESISIGTIGVSIGFVIMMILDIALG